MGDRTNSAPERLPNDGQIGHYRTMSASKPAPSASDSTWSTGRDTAVEIPDEVRDAVDAVLADSQLTRSEREILTTRIERWYPDVSDGLVTLYGEPIATRTAAVLLADAARTYAERDPELRHLDLARTLDPTWIQDPSRIGYAGYTERFAGDLRGVIDRIPYLRELGVSYLHLMPLLTPRPGDSDGGYAVADYRSVRPDLGDMDDLADLTAELRRDGISLVIDLVLNHVAAEHEWAERARAGEQRYRDYFFIYPDRTEPDEYEKTLPEIFPDFAPGNFTWNDEMGGWVWTTFNSFQWDLNWRNPRIMEEFVSIIMNLANKGVEVLRLDAIAFTIKRKGTDCQGQPEVHAITEVLRAITRIATPAVDLKAEAIVAPTELLQYLGQGKYTGKVSDLAYHNSLMVQIWSMLATRNVTLAAHALGALPVEPNTATWITYIRCHDDIGWAIGDADADAVGLNGYWHRVFLADWYRAAYPMSDARGLVFQYNPVTNDRRIAGTAASLIGIETAAEAVNRVLVHLAETFSGEKFYVTKRPAIFARWMMAYQDLKRMPSRDVDRKYGWADGYSLRVKDKVDALIQRRTQLRLPLDGKK